MRYLFDMFTGFYRQLAGVEMTREDAAFWLTHGVEKDRRNTPRKLSSNAQVQLTDRHYISLTVYEAAEPTEPLTEDGDETCQPSGA